MPQIASVSIQYPSNSKRRYQRVPSTARREIITTSWCSMVENPLVPDRVQNADLNAAYYFVACRQGITPKSTSAFNLHNDH
jgi:hypothetical protein